MSDLMHFPQPWWCLWPFCQYMSLANKAINFGINEFKLFIATAISRFQNHPYLSLLYFAVLGYAFFKTRQQRLHASAEAAAKKQADKKWFERVWHSPRWIVLAGLCELFIHKVLPFGFWGDAQGRSLQDWPNKEYLRKLLRMGIIPLYIQDGGLDTKQDQGEYVQSKKRACFAFLVPMGYGYTTPDTVEPERRPFVEFIRRLRDNRGYRVAISMENHAGENCSSPAPDPSQPLEVGARHWFELLLPFLPDSVLQRARGTKADRLDQLATRTYPGLIDYPNRQSPIVRVEGSLYKQQQALDFWVYTIAQEVGLEEIWDGEEMRARTVRWCRNLDLHVPKSVRPKPRVQRA
ncbi:hypothetical protein DM02DRAFT_655073 [Periconia macrospinosa]|uniref:Uncharacterized protein n=1 Tax=Periconia macrospinosa TaxID=97972 RepID=A0A2V1DRE4_9PLEO|nr:hypothetical protein DM02DRAFT_655073 [Periconia macrospinosa]